MSATLAESFPISDAPLRRWTDGQLPATVVDPAAPA
jgi:hypothetical protein